MVVALAVLPALLLGFVAGLLTLRRSDEWRLFCDCGVTKTCPLGHSEVVKPRTGAAR